MNGSEEYKFGHMESDIKAINGKIDGIEVKIDNLTRGIGSRVEEHGKDIEVLKERTHNNENHTQWVSKKVDKWVFAFIGAVIGLAGWIFKLGHFAK